MTVIIIEGTFINSSKTQCLLREVETLEGDSLIVWDYSPYVQESFDVWWQRIEEQWKRCFCVDFWRTKNYARSVWVIRIRYPEMFWFRGIVSLQNFKQGILHKWEQLWKKMNQFNPEHDKRILCFLTDSLQEPFHGLWTNYWVNNATKYIRPEPEQNLIELKEETSGETDGETIVKKITGNNSQDVNDFNIDKMLYYPTWARFSIWMSHITIPFHSSIYYGKNNVISTNFRRKISSYFHQHPEENIVCSFIT